MNRTQRCAYLTMDSLAGFYCSDSLTYQPLKELGWRVEEVPWKKANVDWRIFDVVVIRSPWDYFKYPQLFLEVLAQIEDSGTRLANPLRVVKWNLDKSYLRDLESKGIAIVPTLWTDRLHSNDLDLAFDHFASQVVDGKKTHCNEIVVKPTIGAGAFDTFRLNRDNPEQFVEALDVFTTQPAMIQPFLNSVVDRGEYSLFYFGNEFSHCVSKLPKPGDFRVQEEHGGLITARQPDTDMLAISQRVFDAIGEPLLYARIDLVYLPSGELAVIEVELIEPSLYFGYDDRSASRFASALARMIDYN